MCLPDFIKFENITEVDAVIGYRTWKIKIKEDDNNLISEYQNYIWPTKLTSHIVTESNSGIYSYNYNYNNYNYYNNNNYNNYNYYNNYNNYNYNYNNNYYNIYGIIKQYGKVAIHKIGYRSEYAKVDTLFLIRESDAVGDDKFINWIKNFNIKIKKIAERYNSKTMNYQDFIEEQKNK